MLSIRWCIGCRRSQPFADSSQGTEHTVTMVRICMACHSRNVIVVSPDGRAELWYTAPEYAQLGARNV